MLVPMVQCGLRCECGAKKHIIWQTTLTYRASVHGLLRSCSGSPATGLTRLGAACGPSWALSSVKWALKRKPVKSETTGAESAFVAQRGS